MGDQDDYLLGPSADPHGVVRPSPLPWETGTTTCWVPGPTEPSTLSPRRHALRAGAWSGARPLQSAPEAPTTQYKTKMSGMPVHRAQALPAISS